MPTSARLVATTLLLALSACAAPAAPATPVPTPAPTCPLGVVNPPTATLLDADGNDVEGKLGLYDYCGLHGAQLSEGPSETRVPLSTDEINIAISVPDGPPFVAWHVIGTSLAATATGTTLSQGLNERGLESISFAGPPTGDWTIVALLTYPGVTGQVNYYWRVTAP